MSEIHFGMLGEFVSDISGGGTPSREEPDYWHGDIPWASVKDLTSSNPGNTAESITEEGLSSSASRLIPAGTPIVATRMAVGRTAAFARDVAINQDLKAIFANPCLLDKNYLFHFLLGSEELLASKGTGSTVKGIRLDDLLQLNIAVPPLPEQKKIAEILSGIDQVVAALEKQEAKNLDLALSIAQGVFETNRESMRLGDLSMLITKGTTPTSLGMSFSEQGINFIKVESIVEDGIFDPSKFSFVSPDVHIALKRSQIQSDDILFTIAGATVGKIALAQKRLLPANTNQALAIIRVNREVLRPQFAYYWLKSRTIKGIVEKHQTVGAQPNVSLSQIGDFPVPPISLEMQDGICRRLDSIDQMLHSIRKKILRLKYLRQSLSSDLLSGHKRVSV